MKKLLFIFLIQSTLLLAQKSNVNEKKVEVVLGIDKIEKINFVPSKIVSVGNEAILTYQLVRNKKEIILKGLKAGKTSVTLRNPAGDVKVKYFITVTADDNSKMVQELKEFLGEIEGLEIGIKGGQVYLGGQIVVPEDIGKIAIVLNNDKYKDKVMSFVELSPQTQAAIARKMQDEIHRNQMRDVSVRVLNKTYWLEGVVGSQGERDKAELIAITLIPDKIENLARRTDSVKEAQKDPLQNLISVNARQSPPPIPKLVKITAQFVELTKDYNKVFGFKWTPILAGSGGSIQFGKTADGGVSTKSQGTLAGTISNLFPKLASAKSAGHARVIQSGIIIIKDKKEGKLQKESEKPFAIGTGEFTKSEKAVAGFNLTITPTILQQEKIDLRLGLRVSATIGSPPETLTNSISTNLVVKSKESAIAGGIVVNKEAQDFDKNPPFGSDQTQDGSTLFSFLRSKSIQNNRSQFVVFVTPEIIDSASSGTEEIKRKFRKRRR